jgi:hypothetical protein
LGPDEIQSKPNKAIYKNLGVIIFSTILAANFEITTQTPDALTSFVTKRKS